MDQLFGKYPAEVDSYDAAARTCRVRIPGVTDGSNVLLEAVLEYPIGDRGDAGDSKDHTEIRILPGDAVWVMFEAGDARFPIITGYRLKREGSPAGWRRWRHANIEMTADNELVINARRVTWNVIEDVVEHIGGNRDSTVGGKQTTAVSGAMESTAATSKHSAATHQLTAQTQIAGAITTTAGPGGAGASIKGPVTIDGGLAVNNGPITNDGVRTDKSHYHTAQGATANTTTAKP